MRTSLLRTAAAIAVGAAVLVSTPTVGAAAGPTCGITWGSLAKSDPDMAAATVTGLRTGRHGCFDRLVIDLAGPVDGYDVRYVPQVTQDGSGAAMPLRGGAFLQVVVRAGAERRHAASTAGFTTFRQVAWAGSFEGQTTIGLGVRARLPFRVLVLAGPGTGSRLVIDVAHRW